MCHPRYIFSPYISAAFDNSIALQGSIAKIAVDELNQLVYFEIIECHKSIFLLNYEFFIR